ncbi:MAG: DNA adenine methylase [Lachnospiraceae bacterium]|nr:DNA adenine methylase [Lachnospiraceae bacterium]
MSENEERLSPVFKWGGGKRQLLDVILPLIPPHTRYYEPFMGGAAVLLGLQPEYAVINDFNEELINAYKVIRDNPEELIRLLEIHKASNTIEYFYKIRKWDRDQTIYSALTDVEKAARTIYLNRTCFNGLYRVNKQGNFNTPCGKYKNPEIVNAGRIRAIHEYFSTNRIDIRCGDYKNALKYIREGAFVYFDPPYMPPENGDETFTSYTVNGFDEEKQKELKTVCDSLTAKGVKFMLSNSSCSFTRELYKDYNIEIVKARRYVSADVEKRSLIDEILVTNY